MFKLTKELLEESQEGIIYSVIGKITHPWFNHAKCVDSEGKVLVKYVVCRGYVSDWCIYHSLDANITKADYLDDGETYTTPDDIVSMYGAKLHDYQDIQNLIDVDKELLTYYRH